MTFIDVEVEETIVSKEQKLNDAKKAIAGDVPLIPDTPDMIINLPRGRFDGSKWETEVELRELTGADEESLARFKDPADFFDGAITYGTKRIGTLDLEGLGFTERQSVLAGLLIGEREQLFLNITRVTYGDDKELKHVCPSCGVENTTNVILSQDIKCKEMDNPYTVTHTMTTSKGDVLTYRLATGSDQLAVMKRRGATSAEQNTLMISECITKLNDGPVLDPVGTARNLSMKDRQILLENLVENQPSPEMTLELPCASCGFDLILPLSWGDIFRP